MAHEIGHNTAAARAVVRAAGRTRRGRGHPYADGRHRWRATKAHAELVYPSDVTTSRLRTTKGSATNYDGLLNSVATVKEAQRVKIDPSHSVASAVLVLELRQRWGIRSMSDPSRRRPEVAEILNANGDVIEHASHRTKSRNEAWSGVVRSDGRGRCGAAQRG